DPGTEPLPSCSLACSSSRCASPRWTTMAVRGRPAPLGPPLARWPLHRTAAQRVTVQVEDALPCIGPHVGDETPAAAVDPFGLGQVGRRLRDVGEHRSVTAL